MTNIRRAQAKVPERGPICVHCHRRCGNRFGGLARLSGQPLCSKPMDPTRPDCYRMVTVKFHRFRDCDLCMVAAAQP